MTFKKQVLPIVFCAAFSGVATNVSAAIIGVPGEALFVPMVLTSGPDGVNIDTYVSLYVPGQIGGDVIINRYTAPNTVPGPGVTTQQINDPFIYWTTYDENSKKLEDGFCEISSGDMVVWTTDIALQGIQDQQTAGFFQAGRDAPDSLCGPSNRARFAYALFQTVSGADGRVADFAFAGDAVVTQNVIGAAGAWSPPVMPMADGRDISSFDEPRWRNEVIAADTLFDGVPLAQDPSRFAPVTSGIRMNNATTNGPNTSRLKTQMPLSGPATGNQFSIHVHWFDRVNPNRTPGVVIWDDQQGNCSTSIPLPRELNITLYNDRTTIGNNTTPPSWNNLAGATWNPAVGNPIRATDVITAVNGTFATGRPYDSKQMCNPQYWLATALGNTAYPGALGGYVVYDFREEGEPTMAGAGFVNAASVQFSLTEIPGFSWATHMATDLGKQ
jgi:hypothetical protein